MKRQVTPNNIKALLEKKGITSLTLAQKIGTSAPHMSRLINGQSPLKIKWLLKISAYLKVPTSKIAGVDIDSTFASQCDDTLLGAIMGWVMDAGDRHKAKLSRTRLSQLTSFVYKESVEQQLSFEETKYLAFTSVKLCKLLG